MVFTNPNHEMLSKSKSPAKVEKPETTSKEDYSDDDFEDDFEPYETSNEEDNVKQSSHPSKKSEPATRT